MKRVTLAAAVAALSFVGFADVINVPLDGDIAAAVGAANPGDVVQLAEGCYQLMTATTIPAGVTLEGAGQGKTIIEGTGVNGRLFTVNGDDSVLSGLTVQGGKGISLSKGTVTNCEFLVCVNNQGGAINMTGGLVTHCRFEGCYLTDQYTGKGGAAIYMTAGTVRCSELVRNNASAGDFYASGASGAVCLDGDSAVVENCAIVSNKVENISGYSFVQWARVAGVYIKSGTLRNCLVADNVNSHTEYAGGIYMTGGKCYHNTVVGNRAKNDQTHRSGIMVAAGSPDVRNNIFYGNGPTGKEGGCNVAAGTFKYNLIDNAVVYSGASDNITLDPKFVDAENRDYRLQTTSPAVDAGVEIAGVVEDIMGRTRPLGSGYDIGAYEYLPGEFGLVLGFVTTTDTVVEGDDYSVAAKYDGAPEGVTLVVRWYLDDSEMSGEPVAEGMSYTCAKCESGSHTLTVALVAEGTDEPLATATMPFLSMPTTVYVDENGSDTAPYNTPAKAAHTFDAAVGAVAVKAGVTSTVHVAAGEYEAAAAQTFGTPLRVIGAGRDVTTIKGTGSRGASLLTLTGWCEVSGVTFKNVFCSVAGAVISMSDGIVMGCAFVDNTASGVGGAIRLNGGTVTNCVFTGNCGCTGGGIYMSGGIVTHCTFEKNRLSESYLGQGGAAVFLNGGTLRNCDIVRNRSIAGDFYNVGGGGAVCIYGDNAIVEACTIAGNVTEQDQSYAQYSCAAGVFIYKGTLRNSLVLANTNLIADANHAAGIYACGGNIYHNTVVGNYMTSDATHRSGIRTGGGSPVIKNNIFAFNGPDGAGGCNVAHGTFADNIIDNEVSYSGASGNKQIDPKFVNAENRDYRLQATSPAVDMCGEIVGIDVDFNGRERPLGVGYDAGAFEYLPGEFGLVYGITSAEKTYKSGASPSFAMKVEGLSGGDVVTYRWFCDDEEMAGPSVGEDETFVWASPAAGPHKVTAAFFVNGSDTAYASDTYAFDVAPFEVYVDVNGSDTPPYATPATAAHDFESAWNALWREAGVTSVVHVAAGEYACAISCELATPVKILGAGADARVTTTVGDAFLKLNHDEAEVAGVTLFNCPSRAATVSKGLVRDCRFEGNAGGTGGALYLSGGTVSNCVFVGNHAKTGGAVGMNGGLLTDSMLTGNWLGNDYTSFSGGAVYMEGGTMRRCKLIGNFVSSGLYSGPSGGAVCLYSGSPVVENCEIVGNLGHNHGNDNSDYFRCAGACVNAGTLRNCLIAFNTNTLTARTNNFQFEGYGGVLMTGGKAYNNTIASNVLASDPAHRSGLGITSGTAKNNIIALSGPTGEEGGCTILGGTFKYNVTDMDTGIEGNANVATPAFKSAKRGRFQLKSSFAAAINTGDNSVWDGVVNPVDLDGNPRFYKDGIVDLGCYEYRPVGLLLMLR